MLGLRKEGSLPARLPFLEKERKDGQCCRGIEYEQRRAAPANATPAKPAGGTFLCLTEREIAYAAVADGTAKYYIDTGASCHFINEVDALHDYVPFEVPRSITTAESGTIRAYGTGTLKFATVTDGKEVTGEFHRVYYIPDIHTRLISVGKLYSQGWEPRLNRNGFALYDAKGRLVLQVPMKNEVYPVNLQTVYPHVSLNACEIGENETTDEWLHSRLEHQRENPLVALSTGEGTTAVSLYDWHRRMGHRSMQTIADMANGAVTGMVLEDVPHDLPRLYACHSCALTKSQRLPFKTGRTRATEPLELIHGELVGPMPVESVGRCKYGFVLMDDYSRASWVLPLRAKSDAPVKLMENGTGRTIRTVMFDNAREFVAGRMKEFCDQRGIRIISSTPYSPPSNGIAERLVGVATHGTRAMLRDSGLPPRFWAEAMTTFMYLRNRTPTKPNDGKTPFELFYGMKPDVGHIRAFGCVAKVVLPSELLGKLDDRAVMCYLLGYKYDGAYCVWVPTWASRRAGTSLSTRTPLLHRQTTGLLQRYRGSKRFPHRDYPPSHP
jgi:transposase InsO family protein